MNVTNLISSNQQLVCPKTNKQNFKGYNYYSGKSTSSRIGVGAASIVIPGLGQIINGETAKGAAFFLASACNYLLFFRKRNNMTAGIIGRLGIGAWSAYDAYKKS